MGDSMNRALKGKLAKIGITVEHYYIGDEPYSFPPVWGIALRRDNIDVAVIESHGCHTEDDRVRNKYVIRSHRAAADLEHPTSDDAYPTTLGEERGIFKTQREAVARAIRIAYAL
jgi:hypothetical protein